MAIVKICGNTRRQDLLEADRAGADIVGVVVEIATSKRSLDRVHAQNLFLIPTHADKAMLICDRDVDYTMGLLEFVNPYILHLTGSEPPEAVSEIRKRSRARIFKSIHLPAAGSGEARTESCLDRIRSYAQAGVQVIVLDSSDPSKKMYGGTGIVCDWDAAASIVSGSPLPVLLAGGLSPDNVEEAIRKVRPHGVDLASGLESEVGIKDPDKIKLFMERVRRCKTG